MRTNMLSLALASLLIVVGAGATMLASVDAHAQSTSMTEYQFEQRLDRVRRDAARLEKIVTKDWEPVSKKKEHRYKNGLHRQLDELQKQARTEKRRLQSPSSGMFGTQQERNYDYRDLEYTLRQMEQQLLQLRREVNKMQDNEAAAD